MAALSTEAADELGRLGDHVRIARERRGLSASELARRVGLDRRTLAKLEAGDPTVSTGCLLQVLSALGLARGFAEMAAPDLDHEAAIEEIRKIRRRTRRAPRIADSEVDF